MPWILAAESCIMLPIRIFRDTDDPKKPSFHSPLSERHRHAFFGWFQTIWRLPEMGVPYKSSKLGPFHTISGVKPMVLWIPILRNTQRSESWNPALRGNFGHFRHKLFHGQRSHGSPRETRIEYIPPIEKRPWK